MITDLIGIIIWSERPAELADFYSSKIGLAPVSTHGDFTAFEPHPGFRFSIGGAHPDVKGINKDSKRFMLNFLTDDIFFPPLNSGHLSVALISSCSLSSIVLLKS